MRPVHRQPRDRLALGLSGCRNQNKEPTKQSTEAFVEPSNETIDHKDAKTKTKIVSLKVYSAIKLTNYYTNLLFNNKTKSSIPKLRKSGERWRTSQLAYQIPHQDIKLLASTDSALNLDEINFVRSQRKNASQFKASLYYLNPTQEQTSELSTICGPPKVKGASKQTDELPPMSLLGAHLTLERTKCSSNSRTEEQTVVDCCFKCKRAIQLGSSCVRVDNLQTRKPREWNQGSDSKSKQISSHLQSGSLANEKTNNTPIRRGKQDSNLPESTSTTSSRQVNRTATSVTRSEGSNSNSNEDEGLGTGSSSSAQSSSAGSHCDDRETPPQLDSNSRINCDNIELSMDSLKSNSKDASKTKGKRKSRALTWSASLSSLGSSVKFSSSSKSRSETDLKNSSNLMSHDESSACQDTTLSSILFHTECFSCCTCAETLVDLRALIYVNDTPEAHLSEKQQDPISVQENREYVNIEASDDSSSSQLSLYCHRHFVELFKPRCQQCDCLILDEECTEAEGKVWHIKHFCCIECRTPLGGHQYIIVDQSQGSSGFSKNQNSLSDPLARQQNSPYCLQCFDRIFGETCNECGKLITCDSGAINHEQRCWHASADCFKCFQCHRSLLGSAFLPSANGHIYCTFECAELNEMDSSGAGHPTGLPGSGQMSVASYCDPRVLGGPLRTEQSNDGLSMQMGVPGQPTPGALLRHKPLIEYLLANASSDDTSRQLLAYLYSQFAVQLSRNDAEKHKEPENESQIERSNEEADFIAEIGKTLRQIETKGAESQKSNAKSLKLSSSLDQVDHVNQEREVADRRNKLNPFLIDSAIMTAKGLNQSIGVGFSIGANGSQTNNKLATGELANSHRSKSDEVQIKLMMDDTQTRGATNGHQNGHHHSVLANYINLESVHLAGKSQASEKNNSNLTKDNCKRIEIANSVANATHERLPASELNKKEFHAQQQGFASSGFKASQCSPVASLISNEGTMSDHSATSSGVSSANTNPIQPTNYSHKSHSPLSSSSSHSSVSSSVSTSGKRVTGELSMQQQVHQTRVGPNSSQLSERRRRVQPITELSVVDLLAVADDQMEAKMANKSDGFEQLISHFEQSKRQARPNQTRLMSTGGSCQVSATSKQQESFFFELAQRLPKKSLEMAAKQTQPLDTNGLPTIESDPSFVQKLLGNSGKQSEVRPSVHVVTDHYSTVNKNNKHAARKKQQVAADTSSDFFAITSPLLSCQTDELSGPVGISGMRSTSSMSTLNAMQEQPGDRGQATQVQMQQQLGYSNYSNNSLNGQRLRSNSSLGNATFAGTQIESPDSNKQQTQFVQPTTQQKQTKSVSFDPTVKDPPSSGTMTLGRASGLKSALKSSQSHWANYDQQFNSTDQHLSAAGFCSTVASSNTMPASFAQQLRAGASLNAYSAYYDEFGRRVRLSSLLKEGDIRSMGQEMEPLEPDNVQENKSLLSGAFSKLPFTSGRQSRGGRREERQLRLQQQDICQQQHMVTTQQPMSNRSQLFIPQEQVQNQALNSQPVPSGSQQQVGRSILRQDNSRNCQASSSGCSRREHKNYKRRGSHSRHSSRHESKRSNYTSRRRSRHNSSRVYESDSELSSRCSTCSSDESSEDESSIYSDDDRSVSSRSSYTSYTSVSSNEYDSYDTDSSSCSSRSSSANSSRSSSPSSNSDNGARPRSGAGHKAPRSSRRAAAPSRRKRTSSDSRRHESSRSHRSSVARHQRRAQPSRRSSRSSRSSSHSSSSRGNSRRSGSSSGKSRYQERRNSERPRREISSRTSSGRHRSGPPSESSQTHRSSKKRDTMTVEPNNNMNFCSPQMATAVHLEGAANDSYSTQLMSSSQMRAQSPSTLSTGSRSAQNENCKII